MREALVEALSWAAAEGVVLAACAGVDAVRGHCQELLRGSRDDWGKSFEI